ncbi:hypothetical protein [Enterococcus olivae]
MKENREVVQIALEKQTSNKRVAPAKVAVRIKTDLQDIFVYNGASQYLVQTVLKELMPHVS